MIFKIENTKYSFPNSNTRSLLTYSLHIRKLLEIINLASEIRIAE